MPLTKKELRIKRKRSLIKTEQKNKLRNKNCIRKIKFHVKKTFKSIDYESGIKNISDLKSVLSKAKSFHVYHSNKISRILSKAHSLVNQKQNKAS